MSNRLNEHKFSESSVLRHAGHYLQKSHKSKDSMSRHDILGATSWRCCAEKRIQVETSFLQHEDVGGRQVACFLSMLRHERVDATTWDPYAGKK